MWPAQSRTICLVKYTLSFIHTGKYFKIGENTFAPFLEDILEFKAIMMQYKILFNTLVMI